MFHKRHQRVNKIFWRENLRLANVLEGFEARLTARSQEACERFVQRATLHARPQEEQALWGAFEAIYPESDDREVLEAAVKALEARHERKPAAVFAYKLSEYYMFLEKFADAVALLGAAILQTPGDVRLTYALATIYRILGRPRIEEALRMRSPTGTIAAATPAIEAARSALGLTAQDALRLARERFARVLSMNVHPNDRPEVEESVRAVSEKLAELESLGRGREY